MSTLTRATRQRVQFSHGYIALGMLLEAAEELEAVPPAEKLCAEWWAAVLLLSRAAGHRDGAAA